MMQWEDGVYEDPSDGSYEEGTDDAMKLADRAGASIAPQQPKRVVMLSDFEPSTVLSKEEEASYRRRLLTLFVDESSCRVGGTGSVYCATNAFGETFALKVLGRPAPGQGEGSSASGLRVDPDQDAADFQRSGASASASELAFAEEYRCHRLVQGSKGFPRLYGKGLVDGRPAMVMEWIAGISLRQAMPSLAVNERGMLSPLAAARIGRDLFALVERMAFIGGGVVHRDISPSNIMVRTSRASLQEQIDDGRFDLCLIDFGSAYAFEPEDPSFTSATGVLRKATANYAAPEMLTNDIEGIGEQRRSPEVDVYAAASVLYELATGRLPFDLSQAGEGLSFYRIKAETTPDAPTFAHRTKAAGLESLARDPELSVMLDAVCRAKDTTIDDEELWDAVAFVDVQLSQLMMPCLLANQKLRPTAQEMSGALSSFCRNYERNLRSSLAGEPLIPCVLDGMPEGNAEYLIGLRNAVKAALKSASFALFAVVVVATGVLTAGMPASMAVAGFEGWQGNLLGYDVSCLLAFPALLGFALRGRGRESLGGFLRGSAALVAAGLFIAWVFSSLSLPSESVNNGLHSALFAACSSGWCALVMDYAFAVVVPLARRIKRKGLPSGFPALHKALGSGEEGEAPTKMPSSKEADSVRDADNHEAADTIEEERG